MRAMLRCVIEKVLDIREQCCPDFQPSRIEQDVLLIAGIDSVCTFETPLVQWHGARIKDSRALRNGVEG